MTFREAQTWAVGLLREAGVEDAARDARWLLAFAAGVGRDRLTLMEREPLSAGAEARFRAAVGRRVDRVPVSQIIGEKAFFGRDFIVTPDVLTPRPETEILVAEALKKPFTRVLDLGTGSGVILVTLLAERPRARGVGTDISEAAILVAGRNAERHGVADRVVLPLSDWWADTGGRFDLVVSNPPYIGSDEMTSLAPEVRGHEPRIALTDEGDGLSAYRAILAEIHDHLTIGGRLIVEIGATQGVAVADLFDSSGLVDVRIHGDLDGRDRVVAGVMPR